MLIPIEILEASDLAVAQFESCCAGRPGQEVIVVLLLRSDPRHTEGVRFQFQDHLVTEILRAASIAVRRVDIADSEGLEVPVRLAMVCDADTGRALWPTPSSHATGPALTLEDFWDPIDQISPSIQFSRVTNFWT